MRKLILLLLVSVLGFTAVGAQTVIPDLLGWKRLVCNIAPRKKMPKGRSAVYIPQVYYSDEYISVQSDAANYSEVSVIIINSQGETVKNDILEVVAGSDNLYYIDDLDCGTYELTMEFADFTLSGEIEI